MNIRNLIPDDFPQHDAEPEMHTGSFSDVFGATEDGNLPRATESETVLPEGMPSVGSVLHESQQCRPCAWHLGPIWSSTSTRRFSS